MLVSISNIELIISLMMQYYISSLGIKLRFKTG